MGNECKYAHFLEDLVKPGATACGVEASTPTPFYDGKHMPPDTDIEEVLAWARRFYRDRNREFPKWVKDMLWDLGFLRTLIPEFRFNDISRMYRQEEFGLLKEQEAEAAAAASAEKATAEAKKAAAEAAALASKAKAEEETRAKAEQLKRGLEGEPDPLERRRGRWRQCYR